MKDEEEIRRKLSEVEYQYFREAYEGYFEVLPSNCVHNHLHTEEVVSRNEDLSVSVEDGKEIQLCMLGADNPEEWPGNVCEEPETAKKCPFFENKHDYQSMLQEYKQRIANPKVIAHEYKDIAALKWVLADEGNIHLTDRNIFQMLHFFFFSFFVRLQIWLRL